MSLFGREVGRPQRIEIRVTKGNGVVASGGKAGGKGKNAGGGGVLAPSAIAGLTLDIDPSVLALADGAQITSFTESAQGLAFQPFTGSGRVIPVFRPAVAALGGRPTFDWTASGSWGGMWSGSTCQTTAQFTLISVILPTAHAFEAGCLGIGGATQAGYGLLNHYGAFGAEYSGIYSTAVNSHSAARFGGSPQLNVAAIMLVTRDSGGTSRCWINGVQTPSSPSTPIGTPTGGTLFGCAVTDNRRFQGHYGRGLAYNRAITTEERDGLLRWASGYFAITVTLSDGSTYTG